MRQPSAQERGAHVSSGGARFSEGIFRTQLVLACVHERVFDVCLAVNKEVLNFFGQSTQENGYVSFEVPFLLFEEKNKRTISVLAVPYKKTHPDGFIS